MKVENEASNFPCNENSFALPTGLLTLATIQSGFDSMQLERGGLL
jgi:hypothetical protein